MRPVNLIPGDQRRGDQAPLRTGQLSYALIAALVLILGGVAAIVLTGNRIAADKTKVAALQTQQAAAQQQASQLAPYVDFATLQQTRQATVTVLAQSRFDWERVLRELAIVIPGDVWLTSLGGSVDGGAAQGTSSSTSSSLAGGVTGPSLTIAGCATSQRAVAGFLASLREIDGVTRVGLQSSLRSAGATSSGGSSSAGGSSGSGSCSGSRPLESFEALATFDAVQLPAAGTDATTVTATAPPAATTSTTPTAPTTPTTSTTPTTATTPAAPSPSSGSVQTSAPPAPGGSN